MHKILKDFEKEQQLEYALLSDMNFSKYKRKIYFFANLIRNSIFIYITERSGDVRNCITSCRKNFQNAQIHKN